MLTFYTTSLTFFTLDYMKAIFKKTILVSTCTISSLFGILHVSLLNYIKM